MIDKITVEVGTSAEEMGRRFVEAWEAAERGGEVEPRQSLIFESIAGLLESVQSPESARVAGLSDAEFEAAHRDIDRRRARGVATEAHYVAQARALFVVLSTGIILVVPVDLVRALAEASGEDLSDAALGPGGLSVRFPKLGAEITVTDLLDGKFGPQFLA